jgi:CRP-like cAMP-binding protein
MPSVFSARAARRQRENALRESLELERDEVSRAMAQVTVRETAPDEVIIRQGEPPDAMYVIVHGKFEISVGGDDGLRQPIRVLGTGSSFGEIGLLDGVARSADVISRTDGELLVLAATDASRLLAGRGAVVAEVEERKAQLDRASQRRTH